MESRVYSTFITVIHDGQDSLSSFPKNISIDYARAMSNSFYLRLCQLIIIFYYAYFDEPVIATNSNVNGKYFL